MTGRKKVCATSHSSSHTRTHSGESFLFNSCFIYIYTRTICICMYCCALTQEESSGCTFSYAGLFVAYLFYKALFYVYVEEAASCLGGRLLVFELFANLHVDNMCFLMRMFRRQPPVQDAASLYFICFLTFLSTIYVF